MSNFHFFLNMHRKMKKRKSVFNFNIFRKLKNEKQKSMFNLLFFKKLKIKMKICVQFSFLMKTDSNPYQLFP